MFESEISFPSSSLNNVTVIKMEVGLPIGDIRITNQTTTMICMR